MAHNMAEMESGYSVTAGVVDEEAFFVEVARRGIEVAEKDAMDLLPEVPDGASFSAEVGAIQAYRSSVAAARKVNICLLITHLTRKVPMKPTQYTIIQVLLGLIVLVAIVLFYMLLAPHGLSGLSLLALAVFVAMALALVLAAFGPSLLRHWSGLSPPPPMSPADIRFSILVTLGGIAIVVIGSSFGMSWMAMLGIMFGPLCFIFRRGRWN